MDRATLLQIFQSRLERSDYSKLQKQGRTFYQEARRQASNTQARYIFVSSLFFLSRRRSVCVVTVYTYVCLYVVCLYVCMCVCHMCIPLFHVVAVRFRFDFRVFSVHVISVYTGSVVVVLVAVVSRFVTCRCISHVFIYFITFIHSFVPCVCSLYLRTSSPYILLVTFPRSQSTWLHFTRIRELINGTDPNTIGSYEDWKERRHANAPN